MGLVVAQGQGAKGLGSAAVGRKERSGRGKGVHRRGNCGDWANCCCNGRV